MSYPLVSYTAMVNGQSLDLTIINARSPEQAETVLRHFKYAEPDESVWLDAIPGSECEGPSMVECCIFDGCTFCMGDTP